MRSLLAAAAAVDVALDALSEPAPAEPGSKHRTEALRLLLEARAEMAWAVDMWNVAYPDAGPRCGRLTRPFGSEASVGRIYRRHVHYARPLGSTNAGDASGMPSGGSAGWRD
jgi:hypothetical protein